MIMHKRESCALKLCYKEADKKGADKKAESFQEMKLFLSFIRVIYKEELA